MHITDQNKLAIVTGGGSGIGFAIAEKFVRAGIRTVIIGRNQQKLDKAKDHLGELCLPVCFDLNDLIAIPKMVEQITNTYGTADILVNNAGINLKKDFITVSDEEFESIMRTNVSSVFALSREVAKSMIKKGKGNI